MNDEEWLADLEDHIRGGRASVALTTGTCRSLIRLARKGLQADMLAETIRNNMRRDEHFKFKAQIEFERALAAYEARTKEES